MTSSQQQNRNNLCCCGRRSYSRPWKTRTIKTMVSSIRVARIRYCGGGCVVWGDTNPIGRAPRTTGRRTFHKTTAATSIWRRPWSLVPTQMTKTTRVTMSKTVLGVTLAALVGGTAMVLSHLTEEDGHGRNHLGVVWTRWTTTATTLLDAATSSSSSSSAAARSRRTWKETLLPSSYQDNPNANDDEEDEDSVTTRRRSLPVDFMERLAQQPCLRYLEEPATASTATTTSPRPPGIPDTLRLITVDLFPQILDHVDPPSSCQWMTSRNYSVADLCPSKQVPVLLEEQESSSKQHVRIRPFSTSNRHAAPASSLNRQSSQDKKKKKPPPMVVGHVTVEQKAWIQAMYQCVHPSTGKVGLQLLEASTARLNPYNLRRTHEYGRFHYNSDKYYQGLTSTTAGGDGSSNPTENRDNDNDDPSDEEDLDKLILEAPWHQYAWKEEMMLRISGQVGFGAELEAVPQPSWWNRLVFGWMTPTATRRVFQSTIPPMGRQQSSSWMDTLWFGLLGSSTSTTTNRDGLDGQGPNNRASHKPHAVIANGVHLQRERQALRWLKALCKQHNVPLFLLYDDTTPWTTTNESSTIPAQTRQQRQQETVLEIVLRNQVLPLVQERLIRTSLRHSAGTAFEKGRALGRWEGLAQAWWRQSSSSNSAPLLDAIKQQQEKEDDNTDGMEPEEHDKEPDDNDNKTMEELQLLEDWSALDEEDLRQELESRGILVVHQVVGRAPTKKHNTKRQGGTTTVPSTDRTTTTTTTTKWTATTALLSIAHRLVHDQTLDEPKGKQQPHEKQVS